MSKCDICNEEGNTTPVHVSPTLVYNMCDKCKSTIAPVQLGLPDEPEPRNDLEDDDPLGTLEVKEKRAWGSGKKEEKKSFFIKDYSNKDWVEDWINTKPKALSNKVSKQRIIEDIEKIKAELKNDIINNLDNFYSTGIYELVGAYKYVEVLEGRISMGLYDDVEEN